MSSPPTGGRDIRSRPHLVAPPAAAPLARVYSDCGCAVLLRCGQKLIAKARSPLKDQARLWSSMKVSFKMSETEERPNPDPPGESTKASLRHLLPGQDIREDIIPGDQPVAQMQKEAANIQLRRWIVLGLGILMAIILIVTPLVAVIDPAFARDYLQIALTGLFGLGGPVVGFLFAREGDK